MFAEGYTCPEIRLQLKISDKTLNACLKSGRPAGDPDLDQLSFFDGMTERERRNQTGRNS